MFTPYPVAFKATTQTQAIKINDRVHTILQLGGNTLVGMREAHVAEQLQFLMNFLLALMPSSVRMVTTYVPDRRSPRSKSITFPTIRN